MLPSESTQMPSACDETSSAEPSGRLRLTRRRSRWPASPAMRFLRAKDGEDLTGVAQPGLEEIRLVGFASQLGHRPYEAVPVEDLVVPGGLDLFQRRLAPKLIVAGPHRFEVSLVRLDIAMEIIVTRG